MDTTSSQRHSITFTLSLRIFSINEDKLLKKESIQTPCVNHVTLTTSHVITTLQRTCLSSETTVDFFSLSHRWDFLSYYRCIEFSVCPYLRHICITDQFFKMYLFIHYLFQSFIFALSINFLYRPILSIDFLFRQIL